MTLAAPAPQLQPHAPQASEGVHQSPSGEETANVHPASWKGQEGPGEGEAARQLQGSQLPSEETPQPDAPAEAIRGAPTSPAARQPSTAIESLPSSQAMQASQALHFFCTTGMQHPCSALLPTGFFLVAQASILAC